MKQLKPPKIKKVKEWITNEIVPSSEKDKDTFVEVFSYLVFFFFITYLIKRILGML